MAITADVEQFSHATSSSVSGCQAADVAVRRAQAIQLKSRIGFSCYHEDGTMASQASSVFQASDGAAHEMWLGRWSSRLACGR
jgi:hypothetical protein